MSNSRVTIPKGSSYKVEGPASIRLLEGSLSVLGKPVKIKESLTVPRSRSLPLEAIENSVVEVKAGPEAKIEPLSSATIPREWYITIDRIIGAGAPLRVMVFGDIDSGKTAFCTYLANRFIEAGFKVGVLDCDPGQAEVFVPTTISLGLIKDYVTSLDKAVLKSAYFIGATSPSGLTDRVIVGAKILFEEAVREGVEALIINTSGWTTGRGARFLKAGLLGALKPSHLVLIQRSTEVEHLAKPYINFKEVEVLRVPVSSAIKARSKEDRRVKRELAYKGYFARAKIRKYSLDVTGLMYTLYTTGFKMSKERKSEVESILGLEVIYGEEGPDSMFVVVDKPISNSSEAALKLKEAFGKEEVLVIHRGAEKGLIAGLIGQASTLLGLGIIEEIDYEERTISLLTPFEGQVSIIQVGQLKLDEEGRELAKIEGWPL